MFEAFLVVMVLRSTDSTPVYKAFPQESMIECRINLAAAKMEVATGGDAEAAVAMFCTPDLSTFRGDTGHQGYWKPDEVEGPE